MFTGVSFLFTCDSVHMYHVYLASSVGIRESMKVYFLKENNNIYWHAFMMNIADNWYKHSIDLKVCTPCLFFGSWFRMHDCIHVLQPLLNILEEFEMMVFSFKSTTYILHDSICFSFENEVVLWLNTRTYVLFDWYINLYPT